MKKLTIKNVSTVLECMVAEDGEIKPYSLEFAGKLSQREVMKTIENIAYVANSVSINIVSDIKKIPYSVLEKLLIASECDCFLKDFSKDMGLMETLFLGQDLYYRWYYDELNIPCVTIINESELDEIEEDSYRDYRTCNSIAVPLKTLEFIESKYKV